MLFDFGVGWMIACLVNELFVFVYLIVCVFGRMCIWSLCGSCVCRLVGQLFVCLCCWLSVCLFAQ